MIPGLRSLLTDLLHPNRADWVAFLGRALRIRAVPVSDSNRASQEENLKFSEMSSFKVVT